MPLECRRCPSRPSFDDSKYSNWIGNGLLERAIFVSFPSNADPNVITLNSLAIPDANKMMKNAPFCLVWWLMVITYIIIEDLSKANEKNVHHLFSGNDKNWTIPQLIQLIFESWISRKMLGIITIYPTDMN